MVSGSRIYDINGEKLPSVTTILKATESKEKKESLQLWRSRIGDTAADEIIKRHKFGWFARSNKVQILSGNTNVSKFFAMSYNYPNY